jgi:hypothetical protein
MAVTLPNFYDIWDNTENGNNLATHKPILAEAPAAAAPTALR